MQGHSHLPSLAPPGNGPHVDHWMLVVGPSGNPVRRTLLHLAAQDGCLHTMQLLLQLGADCTLPSPDDGATALHCAASAPSNEDALDAIKLLLQHGADRDLPDLAGNRALDILLRAHVSPRVPSNSATPITSPGPAHVGSQAAADHAAVQQPESDGKDGEEAAPARTSHRDQETTPFSTPDFRMYKFKVEDCPCGAALPEEHDWTECPFAHPGEKARRRDPRKYQYSSMPCPDFRKGTCKRGDVCGYAHGVFEGWLHPDKYRTQMCKDGATCNRLVCFFAHTIQELRPEPEQPTPAPATSEPDAASATRISQPGSPNARADGQALCAARLLDQAVKPNGVVSGSAPASPKSACSSADACEATLSAPLTGGQSLHYDLPDTLEGLFIGGGDSSVHSSGSNVLSAPEAPRPCSFHPSAPGVPYCDFEGSLSLSPAGASSNSTMDVASARASLSSRSLSAVSSYSLRSMSPSRRGTGGGGFRSGLGLTTSRSATPAQPTLLPKPGASSRLPADALLMLLHQDQVQAQAARQSLVHSSSRSNGRKAKAAAAKQQHQQHQHQHQQLLASLQQLHCQQQQQQQQANTAAAAARSPPLHQLMYKLQLQGQAELLGAARTSASASGALNWQLHGAADLSPLAPSIAGLGLPSWPGNGPMGGAAPQTSPLSLGLGVGGGTGPLDAGLDGLMQERLMTAALMGMAQEPLGMRRAATIPDNLAGWVHPGAAPALPMQAVSMQGSGPGSPSRPFDMGPFGPGVPQLSPQRHAPDFSALNPQRLSFANAWQGGLNATFL